MVAEWYTAGMSAFLTIVVVHLLGAMSPGPDFAMIVRNSLTYSRRTGIWTATGLGLGILVHVTYALLGIGLIVSQSILLYNALKYLGAAYLLFIGWKALMMKTPAQRSEEAITKRADIRPLEGIRTGFLCNVLNPKATLFFVALFSQVIAPSTPMLIQAFYGAYMAVATAAWFSLVSCILTTGIIRRQFEKIQVVFERMMGALLIALGIKVALAARE